MERLARLLGLGSQSFGGVMGWLLELRRTLGIPETLGVAGVPAEGAARVAAAAAIDPTAATNPVPLDVASLEILFLDCVRGNL